MMTRTISPLAVVTASALAVCSLLVATPAAALRCDTDAVPAATLLIPYFEIDLERPDERTTLFSLSNEESEPVLANVVLWTDWGVPTFSFEVYLAGHDVQSFNLTNVLVRGRLPPTGSAVSPHGVLSEPPVEFPGCNDTATPGAAPVYPAPALDRTEVMRLQAFHTGECFEGEQAGARNPTTSVGDLARGYITVDVVERCSGLTPADEGYFAAEGSAVAGFRNALMGDYFLVDGGEDFAQGEQALHLEAFPEGFASGDYTFYKRHVAGTAADRREPLGTQYSVRHLSGELFDAGTELLVWRDPGSPEAEPVACGEPPEWFGTAGLASYSAVIGEEGAAGDVREFPQPCVILPPCVKDRAFPLVTQNASLGTLLEPFRFGKAYLNLREASSEDPGQWTVLQGWVSARARAFGRLSIGERAVRLDSACDPGPSKLVPSDFE